MTSYIVHIYRELRLVYGGIEAASHAEAAGRVRDLNAHDADSVDDCDGESFAALVDVAGDQTYERSRIIEFEAECLRKAAPAQAALLDLLRYGLLTLTRWGCPV